MPDSFPWLVADIGSTHARSGLVGARRARASEIVTVRCAEFASAQSAALGCLQRTAAQRGAPARPRRAAPHSRSRR